MVSSIKRCGAIASLMMTLSLRRRSVVFLCFAELASGVDDDRNLRMGRMLFDLLDQLDTAHIGKSQIHDDAVEVIFIERRERFGIRPRRPLLRSRRVLIRFAIAESCVRSSSMTSTLRERCSANPSRLSNALTSCSSVTGLRRCATRA